MACQLSRSIILESLFSVSVSAGNLTENVRSYVLLLPDSLINTFLSCYVVF